MKKAWRGKARTEKKLGRPIYQWLPMAMVVDGFFISALPMGVDPPLPKRRFARLSD